MSSYTYAHTYIRTYVHTRIVCTHFRLFPLILQNSTCQQIAAVGGALVIWRPNTCYTTKQPTNQPHTHTHTHTTLHNEVSLSPPRVAPSCRLLISRRPKVFILVFRHFGSSFLGVHSLPNHQSMRKQMLMSKTTN